MTGLTLSTAITGGIRSDKYKNHANPDIAKATLQTNGQEYDIEGIHIYVFKTILNLDDAENPHYIGIYLEASYIDKNIKYAPIISFRSNIANQQLFNYTVDRLVIKIDGFINYLATPNRLPREEYPVDSYISLEFTDKGVQRMNRWFSRNY